MKKFKLTMLLCAAVLASYAQPGIQIADFPQVNGAVYDIQFSDQGDVVYLAGSFTQVGDSVRAGLAAININTKQVTPLFVSFDDANPNTADYVTSIVVTNNTIYAGGKFDVVNGDFYFGLVKIDFLSTGLVQVDPNFYFPLNSGGEVRDLAFDEGQNKLYVVGNFTSVGGEARNNAAAIDLTSNTVAAWNPDLNGQGRAIKLHESKVLLGGFFSAVDVTSVSRFAVIDTTTGTTVSTNYKSVFGGSVESIDIDGNAIYIGGSFSQVGDSARLGIAKMDLTTGDVLPWRDQLLNNSTNFVQSVRASSGGVYVGGRFSNLGVSSLQRVNGAELDAAYGILSNILLNNSFPSQVNVVNTIGGKVYFGATNDQSFQSFALRVYERVDTLEFSDCSTFTSPLNNIVYTESGNYSETYPKMFVNPSNQVVLTVTIDTPPNDTIIQVNNTIVALEPNADQYMLFGDCTFNVILGDFTTNVINPNIVVPENSTYEVRMAIQKGACYAESNCLELINCDNIDTDVTVSSDTTLIAAQTGVEYLWFNCSNNTEIASATTASFKPTISGDYKVVITTNNGVCVDTSSCISVTIEEDITVGIKNISKNTLNVYPNPASNLLIVESKFSNATVSIISLNGKELFTEKVSGNKASIDVSSLATGMYIVEVKNTEGVFRSRMIKD